MRILKHTDRFRNIVSPKEFTFEDAIDEQLTPHAYSYETRKEKIEETLRLHKEMMIAIVKQMSLNNLQLGAILTDFVIED